MYIHIYIYIYLYRERERETATACGFAAHRLLGIRDKNLYTTTNKCLQCLLDIMYTVF